MADTRRLIEIVVEGETGDHSWTCGIEFQYANRELVYARPRGAKDLDRETIRSFPPAEAQALGIVHVPPLSGIERDEPRRDRGMQDLLVGQGRPGEILRNLLFEIAERDGAGWPVLARHVHELFRIELIRPAYAPAQPYIVCEYREAGHGRPLDLANAGSGTLQVLLMLAFLYARPATVILLDEPDAHQHVILQRQVYDLIRGVARERGGQVVLATHSEVVLDATEPERVLGFFGKAPRALASRDERSQLREALKRITTTDLLLGRDVGAILYVEGETDEKILREWARTLDHPARVFFDRAFVHWLGGRSLREATAHFFALRAAFPNLRAACLLDGDNRDEPDEQTTRAGLVVLRWRRYEIENYLLQPDAIVRFASRDFELLRPSLERQVDEVFWRQVPAGNGSLRRSRRAGAREGQRRVPRADVRTPGATDAQEGPLPAGVGDDRRRDPSGGGREARPDRRSPATAPWSFTRVRTPCGWSDRGQPNRRRRGRRVGPRLGGLRPASYERIPSGGCGR